MPKNKSKSSRENSEKLSNLLKIVLAIHNGLLDNADVIYDESDASRYLSSAPLHYPDASQLSAFQALESALYLFQQEHGDYLPLLELAEHSLHDVKSDQLINEFAALYYHFVRHIREDKETKVFSFDQKVAYQDWHNWVRQRPVRLDLDNKPAWGLTEKFLQGKLQKNEWPSRKDMQRALQAFCPADRKVYIVSDNAEEIGLLLDAVRKATNNGPCELDLIINLGPVINAANDQQIHWANAKITVEANESGKSEVSILYQDTLVVRPAEKKRIKKLLIDALKYEKNTQESIFEENVIAYSAYPGVTPQIKIESPAEMPQAQSDCGYEVINRLFLPEADPEQVRKQVYQKLLLQTGSNQSDISENQISLFVESLFSRTRMHKRFIEQKKTPDEIAKEAENFFQVCEALDYIYESQDEIYSLDISALVSGNTSFNHSLLVEAAFKAVSQNVNIQSLEIAGEIPDDLMDTLKDELAYLPWGKKISCDDNKLDSLVDAINWRNLQITQNKLVVRDSEDAWDAVFYNLVFNVKETTATCLEIPGDLDAVVLDKLFSYLSYHADAIQRQQHFTVLDLSKLSPDFAQNILSNHKDLPFLKLVVPLEQRQQKSSATQVSLEKIKQIVNDRVLDELTLVDAIVEQSDIDQLTGEIARNADFTTRLVFPDTNGVSFNALNNAIEKNRRLSVWQENHQIQDAGEPDDQDKAFFDISVSNEIEIQTEMEQQVQQQVQQQVELDGDNELESENEVEERSFAFFDNNQELYTRKNIRCKLVGFNLAEEEQSIHSLPDPDINSNNYSHKLVFKREPSVSFFRYNEDGELELVKDEEINKIELAKLNEETKEKVRQIIRKKYDLNQDIFAKNHNNMQPEALWDLLTDQNADHFFYGIKKITARAFNYLLKNLDQCRYGFNLDNLPAGFFCSRDEGNDIVLDYNPLVSTLKTRHEPLRFKFETPLSAESWQGDMMQFLDVDSCNSLRNELYPVWNAPKLDDCINHFFNLNQGEISQSRARKILEKILTNIDNNNNFIDRLEKLFDQPLTVANIRGFAQVIYRGNCHKVYSLLDKLEAVKASNQQYFSSFKRCFIDTSQNWNELITEESLEAIQGISHFSKDELVWWQGLTEQHTAGRNHWADLSRCFKSFQFFIESLEEISPGIKLPSPFPLRDVLDMHLGLDRLLCIFENAYSVEEQMRQLDGLELNALGAFYASYYENFNIVSKEMHLIPDKFYHNKMEHIKKIAEPQCFYRLQKDTMKSEFFSRDPSISSETVMVANFMRYVARFNYRADYNVYQTIVSWLVYEWQPSNLHPTISDPKTESIARVLTAVLLYDSKKTLKQHVTLDQVRQLTQQVGGDCGDVLKMLKTWIDQQPKLPATSLEDIININKKILGEKTKDGCYSGDRAEFDIIYPLLTILVNNYGSRADDFVKAFAKAPENDKTNPLTYLLKLVNKEIVGYPINEMTGGDILLKKARFFQLPEKINGVADVADVAGVNFTKLDNYPTPELLNPGCYYYLIDNRSANVILVDKNHGIQEFFCEDGDVAYLITNFDIAKKVQLQHIINTRCARIQERKHFATDLFLAFSCCAKLDPPSQEELNSLFSGLLDKILSFSDDSSGFRKVILRKALAQFAKIDVENSPQLPTINQLSNLIDEIIKPDSSYDSDSASIYKLVAGFLPESTQFEGVEDSNKPSLESLSAVIKEHSAEIIAIVKTLFPNAEDLNMSEEDIAEATSPAGLLQLMDMLGAEECTTLVDKAKHRTILTLIKNLREKIVKSSSKCLGKNKSLVDLMLLQKLKAPDSFDALNVFCFEVGENLKSCKEIINFLHKFKRKWPQQQWDEILRCLANSKAINDLSPDKLLQILRLLDFDARLFPEKTLEAIFMQQDIDLTIEKLEIIFPQGENLYQLNDQESCDVINLALEAELTQNLVAKKLEGVPFSDLLAVLQQNKDSANNVIDECGKLFSMVNRNVFFMEKLLSYGKGNCEDFLKIFDLPDVNFNLISLAINVLDKNGSANNDFKLIDLLQHDAFKKHAIAIEGLYVNEPYPPLSDVMDCLDSENINDGLKNLKSRFGLDPYSHRENDTELLKRQFSTKDFKEFVNDLRDLNYQRPLSKTQRQQLYDWLVYINGIGGGDLPVAVDPDNEDSDKKLIKDMGHGEILKLLEHYRKALQNNPEDEDKEIVPKLTLIALFREVMYRATTTADKPGLFAFPTQLLYLLLNMQQGENNFACQLATGQGKSLTNALDIAMSWAEGRRVFSTTKTGFLADEGLRQNRRFFDYLGIRANLIDAGSSYSEILNADVHYSGAADFPLFCSKMELAGQADFYNNAVLNVDECDAFVQDTKTRYRIAKNLDESVCSLESPYIFLYEKLIAFVDNKVNDSIKKRDTYKEAAIKHIEQSCRGEQRRIFEELKQGGKLDERLITWLKAARKTRHMKEGEIYKLATQDGYSKACVLDNGSPADIRAEFSDAIQQFLHVRLNEAHREAIDRGERKKFLVKPEKSYVVSKNSNLVLDKFPQKHMMSATPGSFQEIREQNAKHNFHFFSIPRAQTSNLKELPAILTSSKHNNVEGEDDEHVKLVVDEIIRFVKDNKKKEINLLVCCLDEAQGEKIKNALDKKLTDRLKKKLDDDGGFVKTYYGSVAETSKARADEEREVIERAAKPGSITISNVIDRGVDIKPSSKDKGLYVIMTYVDTAAVSVEDLERKINQIFGRTARQDNNGLARSILKRSEFKDAGYSHEELRNLKPGGVKDAIARLNKVRNQRRKAERNFRQKIDKVQNLFYDEFLKRTKGVDAGSSEYKDMMQLWRDFLKQYQELSKDVTEDKVSGFIDNVIAAWHNIESSPGIHKDSAIENRLQQDVVKDEIKEKKEVLHEHYKKSIEVMDIDQKPPSLVCADLNAENLSKGDKEKVFSEKLRDINSYFPVSVFNSEKTVNCNLHKILVELLNSRYHYYKNGNGKLEGDCNMRLLELESFLSKLNEDSYVVIFNEAVSTHENSLIDKINESSERQYLAKYCQKKNNDIVKKEAEALKERLIHYKEMFSFKIVSKDRKDIANELIGKLSGEIDCDALLEFIAQSRKKIIENDTEKNRKFVSGVNGRLNTILNRAEELAIALQKKEQNKLKSGLKNIADVITEMVKKNSLSVYGFTLAAAPSYSDWVSFYSKVEFNAKSQHGKSNHDLQIFYAYVKKADDLLKPLAPKDEVNTIAARAASVALQDVSEFSEKQQNQILPDGNAESEFKYKDYMIIIEGDAKNAVSLSIREMLLEKFEQETINNLEGEANYLTFDKLVINRVEGKADQYNIEILFKINEGNFQEVQIKNFSLKSEIRKSLFKAPFAFFSANKPDSLDITVPAITVSA